MTPKTLFGMVRSSRIVRIVAPTTIPGDTLSGIYAKSFRWTFYTIFILTFAFYFAFHADHPSVQQLLKSVSGGLSAITQRHHADAARYDVNGIFFIIFAVYAAVFFLKHMKRIEPSAWDTGLLALLRAGLTALAFFPASYLVITIGTMFESHPQLSFANLVFLAVFSYVYGFMSTNFVRILLIVSGWGGWRVTRKDFDNSKIQPD